MRDDRWSGCAVIVLAGGASVRMGADKLGAALGHRPLLQHVVDGVPAGVPLVVVGPERVLARTGGPAPRWAREDPAGGGPAAGVAAGLGALGGAAAGVVVVLAGDAPWAPAAVPALLAALGAHPRAGAAVAVDATGRRQPLLAAHRGAALAALLAGAAGGAAGRPASWLLGAPVGPGAAVEVVVPDETLADVDTPADLAGARRRVGACGGGGDEDGDGRGVGGGTGGGGVAGPA